MAEATDELRSIDVEIAREVCGWRWFLPPGLDAEEAYLYAPDDEGVRGIKPEYFVRTLPTHAHPHLDRVPRYSTDPAAAVALLGRWGFGAAIVTKRNYAGAAELWECQLSSSSPVSSVGRPEVWREYAPTMPMAVARAVLAAARSPEGRAGLAGATCDGGGELP